MSSCIFLYFFQGLKVNFQSSLGCPWKLVLVSKLGYNLLTGFTSYLYRGYNPCTKYHDIPAWFAPLCLVIPTSAGDVGVHHANEEASDAALPLGEPTDSMCNLLLCSLYVYHCICICITV